MRVKGGRKKADKRPGRAHYDKSRWATQILNGQVNDSSGKWVDIGRPLDTKMQVYYSRQLERRLANNKRNQSARKRRGQYSKNRKPHA